MGAIISVSLWCFCFWILEREREREREWVWRNFVFNRWEREIQWSKEHGGVAFFFLGESEPFVLFQESKKVESFFWSSTANWREIIIIIIIIIILIVIATLYVTSSSLQQWSNLHSQPDCFSLPLSQVSISSNTF